jgi:hypothetical protein
MPVIFEELAGSPTLSFTRKSAKAKQVLRCAWGDWPALVREVFPSPYVRGNRIIIPPARSYIGSRWIIANNVDIEPFDPESPRGLYEFPNVYPGGAKVTVSFETPEYDQSEPTNDGPAGNETMTFVSYKVSVGAEFLTYPNFCLRWDQPSDSSLDDSPGAPLSPRHTNVSDDTQASVIIPLIEHTLTWPHVAFPPWNAIRACVGKVNAFRFAGAPAETLLFLGAECSREITSEGIRAWSVEYKFSEKNQNPFVPTDPQGWNHFLRPDGPSAGQFMRLNKRVAGGYTTLRAAASASTSIQVVSNSSFPQQMEVDLKIGGTLYKRTAGGTTNNWTLDNPVTAASGAGVAQVYQTTLTSGMNKTQTTMNVTSASVFPRKGQFFVKVDNEVMAVTGGKRTNQLVVLRGVKGTKVASHSNGSSVEMTYGGVYDLADFRLLFLSGLVTG